MMYWNRNEMVGAAESRGRVGARRVGPPRSPALTDEAELDLAAGPAEPVGGLSETEATRPEYETRSGQREPEHEAGP